MIEIARFFGRQRLLGLLAAGALGSACVGTPPPSPNTTGGPGTGVLSLPLTTVANGITYRLANLDIFVEGPLNQALQDANPAEAAINASLPAGTYQVLLEEWTLEREDNLGNFDSVMATLESNSNQSVSIYNGTTSTITYRFKTDGVIVTVGAGDLTVNFGVDMTRPECTPLGIGCASGAWCAPTGLTGVPIACVPAGTVAVGSACASPASCVANSTCIDTGEGPMCTALCSTFGATCSGGGVCQEVASDYGMCVPGPSTPASNSAAAGPSSNTDGLDAGGG